MNTRKAKEIYEQANADFFAGMLPGANLQTFGGLGPHGCRFRDWPIQGYYLAGVETCTIYYHRKLSQADALATILHEMVHQAERFLHGIDHEAEDAPNHGEIFRDYQAKFRRIGIEI